MASETLIPTNRGNRLFPGVLIAAAALGAVVNGLHPITTGDIEETLTTIAGSGGWLILHIGIIVTILLLVAGLVGLADSLQETRGGPMARVATVLTLIGGTLAVASLAVDGIAGKQLADIWVTAGVGDAPTWLGLFTAVKWVNTAFWLTTVLVFFGLAIFTHGLAARLSGGLPVWAVWGALVSGAGSIVAALIQIPAGGDSPAGEFTFFASSILLTIWALAVGYRW